MRHPSATDLRTACEYHPERAGTPMAGMARADYGALYLCDACLAREMGGTIADIRAERTAQARGEE